MCYPKRKGGRGREKIARVLVPLLLVMALWGCSGILGGTQRRNMAQTTQAYTDGTAVYLPTEWPWEAYIVQKDGKFSLEAVTGENLAALSGGPRVVLDVQRTGLARDMVTDFSGEDAFLEAGFRQLLAEEDYFECQILETGGQYYGILNCYRRCAGRSGSLLANEDLKYSRLLTVEDGALIFGEKMEKTALLACSPTHYIAYRDKMLYSIRKSTGQTQLLLQDQWWGDGQMRFYWAGDVFYAATRQQLGEETVSMLWVCSMDEAGMLLLAEKYE